MKSLQIEKGFGEVEVEAEAEQRFHNWPMPSPEIGPRKIYSCGYNTLFNRRQYMSVGNNHNGTGWDISNPGIAAAAHMICPKAGRVVAVSDGERAKGVHDRP